MRDVITKYIPGLRFLKGLIYPALCLSCGAGSEGVLCPTCLDGFKPVDGPCCTRCGRPFDSGTGPDRECSDCTRKPPSYDSAFAPLRYEGGLVDAIHVFKYRGMRSAAGLFEGSLSGAARERFPGVDVVVPVPLHRRRLAARGFNQSLVLAGIAAGASNARLVPDGLVRTRHTRPQVGLTPKERLGNVRGAFSVRRGEDFNGGRVLLVDDVYTTGATVGECARELRRAGAAGVYVLTVARAV